MIWPNSSNNSNLLSSSFADKKYSSKAFEAFSFAEITSSNNFHLVTEFTEQSSKSFSNSTICSLFTMTSVGVGCF